VVCTLVLAQTLKKYGLVPTNNRKSVAEGCCGPWTPVAKCACPAEVDRRRCSLDPYTAVTTAVLVPRRRRRTQRRARLYFCSSGLESASSKSAGSAEELPRRRRRESCKRSRNASTGPRRTLVKSRLIAGSWPDRLQSVPGVYERIGRRPCKNVRSCSLPAESA